MTKRLATALLAVALAACSPYSQGHAHTDPNTNVQPQLDTPARAFIRHLKDGAFTSQWDALDPTARAEWPSEAARNLFLAAKFPAGSIVGYHLGAATSGDTWTSRETLATRSNLWQVPVSLVLDSSISPAAARAAYSNLPLYFSYVDGKPLVVGEGPASMDAPVLKPAHAPTRTARVPILMYHQVAPHPSRSSYRTDYDYRLDYGLTVTPSEFEAQLSFLHKNGYDGISPVRLVDNLLYGLPLPQKPVLLTFDDARDGVYRYASPLLRRYGFTATLFVPVHLVGWHSQVPAYMDWNELRQLSDDGLWIADHSLNHVELWGLSSSRLNLEALTSKQIIEKHIPQPVQVIAYPGTYPYIDATMAGAQEQSVFSALAQMGYVAGLTDPPAGSTLQQSTQMFQLPRVRVGPDESISDFAKRLSV